MAETGKSFIKKFVGFSLVTWITFALAFISAPISTRLFSPEVLGKINIFNTYNNLFSLFVLMGLDQAYARFFNERPNNKSKSYLLTFCFAFTYALIFVFFILSIPFADILSNALFDENDNLLLCLLFVSVFSSASLRYLNLVYRMEQNIKMYTIQGVLMAVVCKILYICVGFLAPSYRLALIVLSSTHFILAVIFIIIQRSRFEIIYDFDCVFFKDVFKFAIPLVPVSILTWVNTSIPQLVMQRTMDYHSIGIFTSAMGLANMILIVQSGFNSFWVPYTYENYKTQNGQFFKVHRYIVCTLTICALLLVCSQDLIFLLLGEKYRDAKSFFPFLILGPISYTIGEVAGIGIEISKKTYCKLFVFMASIIINISMCLVLRIPFGIAGIAIATSLAAITSMVIKTYCGEKYYKVVINYKYMIACVAFILISAFITLYIPNMALRLPLTIGILLLSLIFYRFEIKELLAVILSFLKKNSTT